MELREVDGRVLELAVKIIRDTTPTISASVRAGSTPVQPATSASATTSASER